MLDRLSAEHLKRAYTACEWAAQSTRIALGDAMHCSIVYEHLKSRVFGGDFDRFAEWWRSNPSAPPQI